MQEMLYENKMKVRSRLEQQRKRLRKERIKESILFTFVEVFILVATLLLLNNMNNKSMNDCKAAGHSQSYCERGL